MVSMQDVKRYCDAIAAAFKPEKIILFGSDADGESNEDSDVDVLVVMPKKRYRRDLGIRIRMKVPAGFPVDVLVRHGEEVARRAADKESFILDITEKGRLMYETVHA
jgi:predicted nucleotidyltransferase